VPESAAAIVAPSEPRASVARLAPLTLILGGARSGKSAYAESLFAAEKTKVYVATAEAADAEMEARVLAHRARRGAAWVTVEEPRDLAGVLAAQARPGHPVLVEALTMWLANLMGTLADVEPAVAELIALLPTLPAPVVLVSDEVGLGIVPETELGRDFRDAAGDLNQRIAALCQRVVFIAAGLPLILKDESI
jgi:adenosylcobinamide kinase/adenosylcobinamide-phosphate guanylyltransferase